PARIAQSSDGEKLETSGSSIHRSRRRRSQRSCLGQAGRACVAVYFSVPSVIVDLRATRRRGIHVPTGGTGGGLGGSGSGGGPGVGGVGLGGDGLSGIGVPLLNRFYCSHLP